MKKKFFITLVIVSTLFIIFPGITIASKDTQEVTHPILLEVFPNVTFYKTTNGITLSPKYVIIAFYNETEYIMPYKFNKLMLNYGIKLNTSNVIDLAKAFIIVSRPWDFSEINFTSVFVLKETVEVKTYSRVNGITDKWEFYIREGQFDYVKRNITGFRQGDYIEVRDAPGPWLPGSVSEYYPQIAERREQNEKIVSRPWDYEEIRFTNISFINESVHGWPVFTIKIETYSIVNGVTDEWKFSIKEGKFRQFDYVVEKVTGVRVGDYIEYIEAPIGGGSSPPRLVPEDFEGQDGI